MKWGVADQRSQDVAGVAGGPGVTCRGGQTFICESAGLLLVPATCTSLILGTCGEQPGMWVAFCIFATAAAATLRWALGASPVAANLPPFCSGVVIDDHAVRHRLDIPLKAGLHAQWNTDAMDAEQIERLADRLRCFRDVCERETAPDDIKPSNAHPALKFAAYAGGGKDAFEAALTVYYHPGLGIVGLDQLFKEASPTIASLRASE